MIFTVKPKNYVCGKFASQKKLLIHQRDKNVCGKFDLTETFKSILCNIMLQINMLCKNQVYNNEMSEH